MKTTALPTVREIEDFFEVLRGDHTDQMPAKPIEDAKPDPGCAQIILDNNSRHLGRIQAIYGKLE